MSRIAPDHPEVEQLRAVLESLLDGHRTLRGCIDRKREAIRTADLETMTRLCEQEEALAQRMKGTEQQRLGLIRRLTARFAPDAAEPMTLRQIGEAIEDPARAGLLALAEALRPEVHAVRRESAIVAGAAQALSRHVTGILQSVNGVLSRVGVYERRGRIALGSQMEFAIDLKS